MGFLAYAHIYACSDGITLKWREGKTREQNKHVFEHLVSAQWIFDHLSKIKYKAFSTDHVRLNQVYSRTCHINGIHGPSLHKHECHHGGHCPTVSSLCLQPCCRLSY
jgi:hypothetical protein